MTKRTGSVKTQQGVTAQLGFWLQHLKTCQSAAQIQSDRHVKSFLSRRSHLLKWNADWFLSALGSIDRGWLDGGSKCSLHLVLWNLFTSTASAAFQYPTSGVTVWPFIWDNSDSVGQINSCECLYFHFTALQTVVWTLLGLFDSLSYFSVQDFTKTRDLWIIHIIAKD